MSENKKKGVTRETLKFVFKTAWKERPSVFLVYLIRFIAEFADKMQNAIMAKFIIDELVLIITSGEIKQHLTNAAFFAGIYIGVQLLTSVLRSTAEQLESVHAEWFSEHIDIQLADHTMKMDYEHTEDPEALDALEKAQEGMSWYSGGIVGVLGAVFSLVNNAAALLGVSVIILFTCPWLLPVQIAALVVITLFNAKNNKLEQEGFLQLAKSNRIFGYVFYQLADFKLGKDIRLYDSTKMMCDKAKFFSDEQIGIWRGTARKQRKNSWVMDLANALRDGISYFYIGFLAVTKAITIGDFSMCVSAAGTLYWSLHGIVSGIQNITQKCAYAHRYIEFMRFPAAMEKGTKQVKPGEHTIEFRHVSFKYPRSEKPVLRDINLTIKSGEHLSIVGLNGAGKTTFIKLLCRLYDVTGGEILVDGVNIKEYSDEEYRKLFAVVFQDFQLFAFSLRENIAFSENADDAELENVLKLAGLWEDAQKLPKGLDTMLYKSFDEDGTDLSGGQRQKTAIARALYRNAPVVILDEPTAALDPVAEYEIYRQFNTLVGGKTAVYISHRLSSCKFCDRIVVFADDTIKESGTHDELVSLRGGIYAEMFAEQAKYYVGCNV
ncbi:MAG: ABC transporter ATP-binding protein/permease [Oscillospiraceae bacterium]|nr:ABC transporter ATP-binding protein/permease [Oscillospiraceae bacterium]